jgi:hypothetical protein
MVKPCVGELEGMGGGVIVSRLVYVVVLGPPSAYSNSVSDGWYSWLHQQLKWWVTLMCLEDLALIRHSTSWVSPIVMSLETRLLGTIGSLSYKHSH